MTYPTHLSASAVQQIDFQGMPEALNTQYSELEQHVHQCMMKTSVCRSVRNYEISPGTSMGVILKSYNSDHYMAVYVKLKPSDPTIEDKVEEVFKGRCKHIVINYQYEKHLGAPTEYAEFDDISTCDI